MASTAQAILGAGKVRIDLYDTIALAYGGYGDPLGADKFEITPDSDLKQKTSKGRSDYGQAIASVVLGKPTKVAVTISAASLQALGMQFQGLTVDFAQAAGTLTDEPHKATLDKWVSLSKRNLSAITVKDAAAGATTYVLGKDYVVNYVTGEFKPLASGAIAQAQDLKVTATALALSGEVIRGGVQPQIRARLKFEGVNLVDNRVIEVEAYEAVLTSSKGFDFLADDFAGIELTGTLVIPDGQTESYKVLYLD